MKKKVYYTKKSFFLTIFKIASIKAKMKNTEHILPSFFGKAKKNSGQYARLLNMGMLCHLISKMIISGLQGCKSKIKEIKTIKEKKRG